MFCCCMTVPGMERICSFWILQGGRIAFCCICCLFLSLCTGCSFFQLSIGVSCVRRLSWSAGKNAIGDCHLWAFPLLSIVAMYVVLHGIQIFKFVIDNSDISLNCLQHIQKRRNFDAKVTCHQPICLLLHAILSGVGVVQMAHQINDHLDS